MITNVELLQSMYTQAMQHGMKQTETSLANATLKKFAELIVLECACIADDMKALGTAESIKQHFGVKE
jgi:hypothetical protein